jgi:tetratricopeptide (TPR) repeat protein
MHPGSPPGSVAPTAARADGAGTSPGTRGAPSAPRATYSRLVAEADRALQTGGTERAKGLYQQALELRPTGPEALAGLGYAALDVGHKKQALAFFRRSMGQSPSYGPAMFGLGEAYRAAGNDQLALENYRRYVEVDPSGEDVQAARRQIQTIEAHLATRAAAPPPQPAP